MLGVDKVVIVINGAGGCGKDTLVKYVGDYYSIRNESAIDPFREVAKALGYDGGKTDKDRKFLSDLKAISIEYNDYPTTYLLERVQGFLNWGLSDILFVHIREPKEIQKFVDRLTECDVDEYGVKVVTLLVRRDAVLHEYGNPSDDDVENYDYDYVFDNNGALENTRCEFLELINEILKDK